MLSGDAGLVKIRHKLYGWKAAPPQQTLLPAIASSSQSGEGARAYVVLIILWCSVINIYCDV